MSCRCEFYKIGKDEDDPRRGYCFETPDEKSSDNVIRMAYFFLFLLLPMASLIIFHSRQLEQNLNDFKDTLEYMCEPYRNNIYNGTACHQICDTLEYNIIPARPEDDKDLWQYPLPEFDLKTSPVLSVADRSFIWIKNDDEVPDIGEKTSTYLIKQYILHHYNKTLDEDALKSLLYSDLHTTDVSSMARLWQLLKNNDFMMRRLYENYSLFTKIFGACGSHYLTERLWYLHYSWNSVSTAIDIMKYLKMFDEFAEEPLVICDMRLSFFVLTADKRIRYQDAFYVQTQSNVDKRLSDGRKCNKDEHCNWRNCIGKCDLKEHICKGVQQNSNWQLFCKNVLPILNMPDQILPLREACISPHMVVPGRAKAPS